MVVLGLSTPITIQKLQVRLHSNLDGFSLAHAIQVPMGPLRNLEVLHLFRWFTHTHRTGFKSWSWFQIGYVESRVVRSAEL